MADVNRCNCPVTHANDFGRDCPVNDRSPCVAHPCSTSGVRGEMNPRRSDGTCHCARPFFCIFHWTGTHLELGRYPCIRELPTSTLMYMLVCGYLQPQYPHPHHPAPEDTATTHRGGAHRSSENVNMKGTPFDWIFTRLGRATATTQRPWHKSAHEVFN